jgi:prevent-host-death family protein
MKNPNRSEGYKLASIPSQRSWQVQSAKAKFSEVFRLARTEGPQRITRQGKECVVMVAEEQFNRLVGKTRQPKSLFQFFQESPLFGLELEFERDPDPGRDVDL